MIELNFSGKWKALKVLDKNPELRGFRVMFDPGSMAFHELLAMNEQEVSFKFQGAEDIGVFCIDANPVAEVDTIMFSRASISKKD